MSPESAKRVMECIAAGRQIEAVRAYSEATGASLEEAMAFVEALFSQDKSPENLTPAPVSPVAAAGSFDTQAVAPVVEPLPEPFAPAPAPEVASVTSEAPPVPEPFAVPAADVPGDNIPAQAGTLSPEPVSEAADDRPVYPDPAEAPTPTGSAAPEMRPPIRPQPDSPPTFGAPVFQPSSGSGAPGTPRGSAGPRRDGSIPGAAHIAGMSPMASLALLTALRNGQKIQAIKMVKDSTGLGLKEAKDVVEELEAALGPNQAGYRTGMSIVPRSGARQVANPVVIIVLIFLLTTFLLPLIMIFGKILFHF